MFNSIALQLQSLLAYIYGFREKDWEKDVSTMKDEQDSEVKAIGEKAQALSTTPEGVHL